MAMMDQTQTQTQTQGQRQFLGYDSQGREVWGPAPAQTAPAAPSPASPATSGRMGGPGPGAGGGPAGTLPPQTGGRPQGPGGRYGQPGATPEVDPLYELGIETKEPPKGPVRKLIDAVIGGLNPIPMMIDILGAADGDWDDSVKMSAKLGIRILQAQAAEFAKAKKTYEAAMMQPEGSAGRRWGLAQSYAQSVAGWTPLIGPAAGDIASDIIEGEYATAAGKGIALLGTSVSPSTLASGVRATGRAADAIARTAERASTTGLARIISPTSGSEKYRFGRMATGAAPEIARDPGMMAWTRASLQDKVNAALEAAEGKLNEAYTAIPETTYIPTAPIIEAIKKAIDDLKPKGRRAGGVAEETRTGPVSRIPPGEQPGMPKTGMELEGPYREVPTPAGALPGTASTTAGEALTARGRITISEPTSWLTPAERARLGTATVRKPGAPIDTSVRTMNTADRLASLERALKEVTDLGDMMNVQNLRKLAEQWGQGAREVYVPATAPDFLRRLGRGMGWADAEQAVRDYMVQKFPQLKDLNSRYHLMRSVSDVMAAAEEARIVSSAKGRRGLEAALGATAGGVTGGPFGALLLGTLAPMLDAAVTSGATTQIGFSRAMARFADALRKNKGALAEFEFGRAAKIVGMDMTKKTREMIRQMATKTGNEEGSIPGPGGRRTAADELASKKQVGPEGLLPEKGSEGTPPAGTGGIPFRPGSGPGDPPTPSGVAGQVGPEGLLPEKTGTTQGESKSLFREESDVYMTQPAGVAQAKAAERWGKTHENLTGPANSAATKINEAMIHEFFQENWLAGARPSDVGAIMRAGGTVDALAKFFHDVWLDGEGGITRLAKIRNQVKELVERHNGTAKTAKAADEVVGDIEPITGMAAADVKETIDSMLGGKDSGIPVATFTAEAVDDMPRASRTVMKVPGKQGRGSFMVVDSNTRSTRPLTDAEWEKLQPLLKEGDRSPKR